ncbi:MAG: hypothetical protein U1A78_32025 [Polyangia bacterium]
MMPRSTPRSAPGSLGLRPLVRGLAGAAVLTLAGPVRAQSAGVGSVGSSTQAGRDGALQPGGGLVSAPPPVVVPAPRPVPPAPSAPANPPSAPANPPSAPTDASSAAADAASAAADGPPVLPPVLPPPPTLSTLPGGEHSGVSAPHRVRRRRWNLVLGGGGLFVASYAADRLLGNSLSSSPVSWVPLVGPWWVLNEQRSLTAPNQTTMALLVISGLLEAGGLTMGILGLFLRTDRMVIDVQPSVDVFSPSPESKEAKDAKDAKDARDAGGDRRP